MAAEQQRLSKEELEFVRVAVERAGRPEEGEAWISQTLELDDSYLNNVGRMNSEQPR